MLTDGGGEVGIWVGPCGGVIWGCGAGDMDLGTGFEGVVAEVAGAVAARARGVTVGVASGDSGSPVLVLPASFFFNRPNNRLFSFCFSVSPADACSGLSWIETEPCGFAASATTELGPGAAALMAAVCSCLLGGAQRQGPEVQLQLNADADADAERKEDVRTLATLSALLSARNVGSVRT
jgi:hypothetical protein